MTQMVKNSHGIMPILTARIGDFYQALQKLQTYHIISEKLFCVSWYVSFQKMKKVVSVCLGFAQFGRVHFTSTLRPQEACALVTQLSVHIKQNLTVFQ